MAERGTLGTPITTPRGRPSERAKLLPSPSRTETYNSIRTIQSFGSFERPRVVSQPSKSPSKLRSGLHYVRGWIGNSGINVRLAERWSKKRRRGEPWGFKDWATDDIPGDHMVVPLLIITFSCALADSITMGTYATFATSMTGNTVLLAMSLLGASSKPPVYAAASLIGFVGMGLIFGQLGGVVGHQRRAWLLSTTIFQILVLISASIIVLPSSHPSLKANGKNGWVYLFLLACQGGPQVTSAANAGARELPTAMMTTPYAAFISDPTLFLFGADTDVRSRNRRFVYIVVFWLGAIAGAAIYKWSTLSMAALIVASLKVVVVVYLVFIEGESQEEEEEEEDEGPFLRPIPNLRRDSVPPMVNRGRRESRDERNVAM